MLSSAGRDSAPPVRLACLWPGSSAGASRQSLGAWTHSLHRNIKQRLSGQEAVYPGQRCFIITEEVPQEQRIKSVSLYVVPIKAAMSSQTLSEDSLCQRKPRA